MVHGPQESSARMWHWMQPLELHVGWWQVQVTRVSKDLARCSEGKVFCSISSSRDAYNMLLQTPGRGCQVSTLGAPYTPQTVNPLISKNGRKMY
eukprot:5917302-Amphidinium_carterae.1